MGWLTDLFIGSSVLFINPIFTAFAIILPRVFSVNASFLPIFVIFGITLLMELVFLLVFLIKKDNMSLQDYIAGTKILEYKR